MPAKGQVHPDRAGLRRWFGNLEVIEAKAELRVQPNEEDIKNAIPNDPKNCVFSRACQRMWSSTAVVFFGTIAYVDLLDKNGVRHVERFTISSEGKRFIRAFDAKKPIRPKGFVLLPPTASTTIEARNARSKKDRRRAVLKGKSTGSNARRPKRKPTGIRLSVFRNGTGMVQFPPKATAGAQS